MKKSRLGALMAMSLHRGAIERKRRDGVNAFLSSVIEGSEDAIYGKTLEGNILSWNAAAERMYGYTASEVIGQHVSMLCPPGQVDQVLSIIKQITKGERVDHFEADRVRKDGKIIPVSLTVSPIRDVTGRIIGASTIARDITERKQKDEELKVYREQLESMVEKRTAELTHTLQRVKEAVNVLASSSSEILSAAIQVASGTAETATAISETTTTVEEVRQAAQLSSEKARIVSDNAQRVAQVSKNGRKAVEDTAVVVMGQIREQMESIAQTIVRLSDQTQSIGGIIVFVTDIADQSNLLAVNAAIEAARVGEQGKGFAVVAQEIKILAEQSKQATAQVQGILSDIQKATGAAVMATEQGSKVVEVGVKQALQADEAIRVLAETSEEAAQSSTQIVASSQQQVVGMDQISIAMKNINQAGGETAASMKQAETAAQNLHELGQKLKEIVEQFKG